MKIFEVCPHTPLNPLKGTPAHENVRWDAPSGVRGCVGQQLKIKNHETE